MAKEIKKATKKAKTPEQIAARKAEHAAYLERRNAKAKEKYAKNADEFIVIVRNRKLLAVVIGKPLTWAEFCDMKATASARYWAAQKAKPEKVHTIKPLTAEQVDAKKAKLAKLMEKIENEKALLAEAVKMLGK